MRGRRVFRPAVRIPDLLQPDDGPELFLPSTTTVVAVFTTNTPTAGHTTGTRTAYKPKLLHLQSAH